MAGRWKRWREGGKDGGKVGTRDLDHEVEISALDESRHADARQGWQHLDRPPRGIVVNRATAKAARLGIKGNIL